MTTALFDPSRHEPLSDAVWSDVCARAALDAIVADTHAAFTPLRFWPIHPLDRSEERPGVLKPLYYGAAGVIWALRRLDALPVEMRDAALLDALRRGLRDDAERLYPSFRHAYLMGEGGIAMLEQLLLPSAGVERHLRATLQAHLGAGAAGVAWGVAGTTLAALHATQMTQRDAFAALFRQGCDALWRQWDEHEDLACRTWTIDLYGRTTRQLGGLHGFAANALPLLLGQQLLPHARRAELVERIVATMRATAQHANGHVNWPHVAGTAAPDLPSGLLQHCIGAPGFVNCLALLPRSDEVDALLLGAGELIWHAGPVRKLPSLCHGVPGSGYAFLKLYRRTHDMRWLERARRFAMHAIAQSTTAREHYGQRKFSLWTGDLGLAVFIGDCLNADSTAALPALECF